MKVKVKVKVRRWMDGGSGWTGEGEEDGGEVGRVENMEEGFGGWVEEDK